MLSGSKPLGELMLTTHAIGNLCHMASLGHNESNIVFRFKGGGPIWCAWNTQHYSDVIMGAMASKITNLMIVYTAVYSGADQRKHQSSASLAFVRGIHRSPVNSPYKGPVTRKKNSFDDVIMNLSTIFTRPHSLPYKKQSWCFLFLVWEWGCLLIEYVWNTTEGGNRTAAMGSVQMQDRSVSSCC